MRRLSLCLVALAALLSPAAAQQAAQSTNWPTTCQALNRQQPLTCVASTVAYLRGGGQRMAELRIVTAPGKPDRLEIIGPFGTSADRPFVVKADGAEMASGSIRTCEQDGCHVIIEITDAMRTALLGATSLAVVFTTPEQPAVEVPLPTLGLADAYKLIAP